MIRELARSLAEICLPNALHRTISYFELADLGQDRTLAGQRPTASSNALQQQWSFLVSRQQDMSNSSSTVRKPYKLDAGALGFLQGLTLHSQAEATSSGSALIHYFGGIPYALPPLGPYRFRQARRLPPCYRYGTEVSPGRFDAGTAVCPQPSFLSEKDKSNWDENCLQLNIYIPAKPRPQKGFPVLFYIHGAIETRSEPDKLANDMQAAFCNGAIQITRQSLWLGY